MRRVSVLAGLTLTALAVCAPVSLHAQMPEGYKAVLLRKLSMERSLMLAMADSMPQEYYRDAVTPIQRDFAQQLHHAMLGVTFLAPRNLGVPAPSLPDTATALNSKAALREYINAAYDWADRTVGGLSVADLNETVDFFGNTMPRWQMLDELYMHTIWTAGQVVANFRKHGMAPPGFSFF